MFPRCVSILIVCLLSFGSVLPVSGQEDDPEQEANGQENDGDDGDEEGESVEPPSMTLVHYGPDSAGGSLASIYPDQARELGEGDTAFTGLFKRESTSERHGGILVVAPSGQSPDQGLAGAIRSQLPEAGWMTLSIAQPGAPVPDVPERVFEPGQTSGNGDDEGEEGAETDNGDQAEEENGADEGNGGDTSDEPDPPELTIQLAQGSGDPERGDDWQTQATERLEAAVETLREEGAEVTVLVGIGDGADLILRYARANGATFPPDGFGMVWLDPRLRPPFRDGLADELGEEYEVPVLDLYDRSRSSERAEDRAAAARRAGFAAYTQSAIPMPRGSGTREQRRVPARIRGWLSNNLKSAEGN
ncbi:MAG: DUF3530 family protein [Halospina sp.]